MMFHRFSRNHTMMSMSASASCANVNRSCARSASANRSIIAVLDAIIMASFIILSLRGILGDCSENRRARHHRLRRTQTPAPVRAGAL